MNRRTPLISEMNVVPYIDVMLVLLVIFMVTVPILQQGIKVDLPKAKTKVLEINEDNQPIILTISKSTKYFLNIGNNQDNSLSPRVIVARVSAMLSLHPNASVLVKSDKNVPYNKVVHGMYLLQKAGAQSIGLITDSLN